MSVMLTTQWSAEHSFGEQAYGEYRDIRRYLCVLHISVLHMLSLTDMGVRAIEKRQQTGL